MSDLKQLAREIFLETLAGVDIRRAFTQKLKREGSVLSIDGFVLDLAGFCAIRVVAMGKAAVPMARGLSEQLSPDVKIQGILVAPHESIEDVPGFTVMGASHPLPDEGSMRAARAVLDLVRASDSPDTLIFFLLSGGSSSLLELPLDSQVTLHDLREVYRLLVQCGAPIDEMNAVRKHLSSVKGGRLAAAAPAAMKISLGVTDVPQGKDSALASGPTLPDPTTIADARRVVESYGLVGKLPSSVDRKFEDSGDLPETPKAGDHAFAHSHFVMLLGMKDLFESARRSAEARGFHAICDNTTDDWPIDKAVDFLLNKAKEQRVANPGRRIAVIADGEVSSPFIGNGIGGRNSAFVLNCVEKLAGENLAVLSAGTDGKDGSSPAAGAIADGHTLQRARDASLDPADYARRCDSYTFFRKLGDALETGPTHNNLRDLRIILAE